MKANLAQVLDAVSPGAAGCFNTLGLDMALAVLDSADAMGLPVVVGIASRHFDTIRAPLQTPGYLKAIEACGVPAALHLDHAGPHQLDMIRQALDLGFTSIMIDGSALSFEENVAVTAEVVELARPYGAGVEGELGALAGEEGVADTGSEAPDRLPYTDADEAARFVARTGVDALAIAVGTAHGIYVEQPHISLETIGAVAGKVDVPLVMHGATGVSDRAIQDSVRCGIRKINYFSGLLQGGMNRVRAGADSGGNDFLAFSQALAADWRALIQAQMDLYAGARAAA